MRVSSKILLYKSNLKSSFLYEFHVWGSTATSKLLIIQTVQNKAVRSVSKSPWYIRNDAIYRDQKVNPIRTFIRKLNTKFLENLYAPGDRLVVEIRPYFIKFLSLNVIEILLSKRILP